MADPPAARPGRRDGQRRPVGHPQFDAKTLFVPQAAAADPALAPMFGRLQRAWWKLKCQHFDRVRKMPSRPRSWANFSPL